MAKQDQGTVFNIQRYSIHDGPGIRTTVFLKGCHLRCYWCQNPESWLERPEIFFNADQCTNCGKCVEVCPVNANRPGTKSALINRRLCTGCGKCAEACPNNARKLIGKCMSVDEVVNQVERDVSFYRNSGGGVTLSGGEPTDQAGFALAILERCKHAGLHTALETCGDASWPVLEALLEFTDFVLFDIKSMATADFKKATRGNPDLILENTRRVAGLKPMRVRVPLIPGFNDSRANIKATAEFVKKALGPVPIDLLPYNKMGEYKFARLGRRKSALETQSQKYVEELQSIVTDIIGRFNEG